MNLSEMNKCRVCSGEPAWSAFGDKAHYICASASPFGMIHFHKMHLKMCENNERHHTVEEWNKNNKPREK